MLCAGLAAGVLVGLLANTTLGIWWLDPTVGLLIAVACVLAGRQSWRGDGCACTERTVPAVRLDAQEYERRPELLLEHERVPGRR